MLQQNTANTKKAALLSEQAKNLWLLEDFTDFHQRSANTCFQSKHGEDKP